METLLKILEQIWSGEWLDKYNWIFFTAAAIIVLFFIAKEWLDSKKNKD